MLRSPMYLLLYSTTDNHTKEICQRIQTTISEQNSIECLSIAKANHIDLQNYDKIIIGASIRYGKHAQEVYDFIGQHEGLLNQKPNAFFSVNVVARKPEKKTPKTNPYVIKFLDQISWKPQTVAVFAGKIDYPKYRFWDKQMIRLIMWMGKGPTDPTSVNEFTDWDAVQSFAKNLSTSSLENNPRNANTPKEIDS